VGWSRPFGPSSTSSPVAESSRASALASGRRKRERPQSLNDEQKARLNALGAEDNRDQQQLRRDLTQVCSERASGIASLPGGPISTAREGNFSKFFDSLNPLRGAARRAVEQLTKGSATSNGSTSSFRQGCSTLEEYREYVDSLDQALIREGHPTCTESTTLFGLH
jgi:hypothetical protein